MILAKKIGLAIGLVLLALPALCTDLAILHNGFSIPHERREVIGSVTRLYLGTGKDYVDIATAQIERFEKDQSPGGCTGACAGRCHPYTCVVDQATAP